MMNKSEMIENVKKAKTGDKGAFSILYQHYSPLLKKYLVKLGADYHDAEDISAETFMEVIEEISSLKNDEYFSTWMYSIAKNKFYTLAKAANKHQRVEFSSYSEEGDTFVNDLDIAAMNSAQYSGDEIVLPEDFAANEDIKRKLAEIINSLGDKEKETVYLRYYEGHSVSEISKETKAAEGTVKARLHHARKYIEKKVKELQSKGYVLSVTPFPVEKMYNILKKSKYAEMITPQAAAVVTAGRSLAIGLASILTAGVVGFTAIFGMGLFHNKDGDKWDIKDDSSIVVEEEKQEEEEPTIIDYSTGNWVDLGVGSEGFYEDPVAHPLSRYYECTNENNDDTFFIEIKSFKQNLDDYKIYVEYDYVGDNPFGDEKEVIAKIYTFTGNGSENIYGYQYFSDQNFYNKDYDHYLAIFNIDESFDEITQEFLKVVNLNNNIDEDTIYKYYNFYYKNVLFGIGVSGSNVINDMLSLPVVDQFDYKDNYGYYKKYYYTFSQPPKIDLSNKDEVITKDKYFKSFNQNGLIEKPIIDSNGQIVINNEVYFVGDYGSIISEYNYYLKFASQFDVDITNRYIYDAYWENELIKNVKILNNDRYSIINDVLYYKFDNGWYYLVWAPIIKKEYFSFPDNVMFCNQSALEHITADNYNYANNEWLKSIVLNSK